MYVVIDNDFLKILFILLFNVYKICCRTTLARFRAAQLAEQGKGQQERRPFLACDCDNLKAAEKWRKQIIGEISKKVAQIQNGLLFVSSII